MLRWIAIVPAAALLASCGSEELEAPSRPQAQETEVPDEVQSAQLPQAVGDEAEIGTPMAERVATIGLLNKRNNLSQDLELRPGEQRRVGDVIVRLRACEKTAPWEFEKDEGAFVQVLVRQRGSATAFARIFSGWLFKNKPSINVVEHPIYDVWVKSCAMEFPDEG